MSPPWLLAVSSVLLFLPLLRAEVSVPAVGAQLLVIPLHHSNFSINHPDVHYTASIAGLPDLPSWLHLSQASSSGVAFLYGVPPPHHSQLMVEVIAQSQHTYDTSRRLFDISISPNKRWHYGVSLKVTNVNLPDLLSDDRHEELLQVVASDLWTASAQVYHSLDHVVVAAPSKRSAAGVSGWSSVQPSPSYLSAEALCLLLRLQAVTLRSPPCEAHDDERGYGGPGLLVLLSLPTTRHSQLSGLTSQST
ncbi:Sarcoglycan alpha/epsilon [Trinorchestia longiramus]|nr:Sarcoglycan alpha/epsilon [Trinorchestia longiramus]